MTQPPMKYAESNDRGNDPWDHDAICWILTHLGPTTKWTYGVLFECARKQHNRLQNDLDRVIEAASICGRYGVEQIEIRDPNLGKDIVRLRRTDSDAPDYPAHYDASYTSAPTRMTIKSEDRAAAERLLALMGPYEAELLAAGKSRSTINTYVDRTERFLKRVALG